MKTMTAQCFTWRKRKVMNVDLTPDMVLVVEGLIASGEYATAEEAVADGIRLLQERQQLKAELQVGIDQLNAGEGIDGEQFFEELLEDARRRCREAG